MNSGASPAIEVPVGYINVAVRVHSGSGGRWPAPGAVYPLGPNHVRYLASSLPVSASQSLTRTPHRIGYPHERERGHDRAKLKLVVVGSVVIHGLERALIEIDIQGIRLYGCTASRSDDKDSYQDCHQNGPK